MKDPEIKRIVGIEAEESLSENEKIMAIFRFNDEIHQLQDKLPGGTPGIPKGVYRFKNQEDADKQVNHYIMKVALLRQSHGK